MSCGHVLAHNLCFLPHWLCGCSCWWQRRVLAGSWLGKCHQRFKHFLFPNELLPHILTMLSCWCFCQHTCLKKVRPGVTALSNASVRAPLESWRLKLCHRYQLDNIPVWRAFLQRTETHNYLACNMYKLSSNFRCAMLHVCESKHFLKWEKSISVLGGLDCPYQVNMISCTIGCVAPNVVLEARDMDSKLVLKGRRLFK